MLFVCITVAYVTMAFSLSTSPYLNILVLNQCHLIYLVQQGHLVQYLALVHSADIAKVDFLSKMQECECLKILKCKNINV